MLHELDTTTGRAIGRNFIHHPASIPIEIYIQPESVKQTVGIPPVSAKGLMFNTNVFLQAGMMVKVSIPVVEPCFETLCWVVWCNKSEHGFEVGLAIVESNDAFHIRMVEQICYIEHYKQHVLENEGRLLSSEEAATEWITKFAEDFPSLDSSTYCH